MAVLRGLGGPLVFAQFHIQVRLIDVYSTADNFEPANIWEIWRLSGDGSDNIHKPMLGSIGLIIANQSSLQQKITM